MAQDQRIYPWVNEYLDGELPSEKDDIIVADSDEDDSPSAKADRKRRREAIGRRYLLGYAPFIESASLRGPFSFDASWINPRKRVHSRQLGPPQSALRRNGDIPVRIIEAANRNHEETCRYDADIEDEVMEPVYDEDYNSLRNANVEDINRWQSKSPSANIEPLCYGSDDDDTMRSQLILHSTATYQSKENSIRCAHLEPKNSKKRNADMGWLKGRNIAKRSRHIFLDRSSPTPAGGLERTTDNWTQLQSSPVVGASVKPHGHVTPQQTRPLNIDHTRANGIIRGHTRNNLSTTDGSPTLEDNFKWQRVYDRAKLRRPDSDGKLSSNDICGTLETEELFEKGISGVDIERAPEGKRLVTALGNQTDTTHICDEVLHEISNEDMHGLEEAFRLATAGAGLNLATATSRRAKADFAELSSPEIGAEMNSSIKEARHLSRVRGLFRADHEIAPLTASISPEIRDRVSAGFEDITAFRNTISPASTQSFQYRRTNQWSESCTMSVTPDKGQSIRRGDDEASTTYGSWTLVSDVHDNSTISISSEVGDVTTIGVLVERKYEKRQRKEQPIRDPISSNQGVRMETTDSSSPDPLSEGFRDSSQARFTSSSSSRWMTVDEIGRNSSQSLKENLYEKQTELAQSDPSSDENYAKGQTPRRPGFAESEGYLQPSARTSSPGPSPPNSKSRSGLDLLQAGSKSLSRPTKPDPALNNAGASRYPKTQHGKGVGKPSPKFERSKVQTRTAMDIHHSSKCPPGTRTTGQVPYFLRDTPRDADFEDLATLSNSKQSPWTTAEAAALHYSRSPTSAPNQIISDEGKDQTRLQETEVDMIGKTRATTSPRSRQSMTDKSDMGQEPDSPNISRSKGYLSKASNKTVLPFTSFPSTQVLVKATTDNPWNSAIKSSTSARIKKSVSFSPLPDTAISSTILSERTNFRSPPPPPPGSGVLADPDDPFYYRLVAAKDVEIDVKSPTKSRNARRSGLAAMKSRAKLPPPSPAVDAMAEAFIAADKQTLGKVGDGGRHNETPSQPRSRDYHDVENSSTMGLQRLQARSSSPVDDSFTIAPNGRLTAVNVDASAFDAELNLADVIEDMGSFFEGWDIDTELRKARGNRDEKSTDVRNRRQRGYLSGVSNC